MNLANITLQSFRFLLLPFSLVYGCVLWSRNKLYDLKIIRAASFNLPVICIGNLSVGGTGKSPMTEYLVELLKDSFKLAVLSRGYKRKTRGYVLASENTTELDIGDEPMMIHLKHPEIAVAVGEERVVTIPQLLHDRPATELILLDDAFQHRALKAGLNILLTDYYDLFTRDFFLPTGNLRDIKSSSRRAEILVVTKCPPGMDDKNRKRIIKEIRPLPQQKIFFTCLKYGRPVHIIDKSEFLLSREMEVLLATGIANTRPLKKYLSEKVYSYDIMSYNDHYIFTISDLKEILKRFNTFSNMKKVILTTEKDAVRLMKFKDELRSVPMFVLPVQHQFLFNEAELFSDAVVSFIRNFRSVIQEEK